MTKPAYGAEWQKLCKQAYVVYGYVCHLCGKPIDPTLPKSNRMSKTVDHLDDVALYGDSLPSIDRVRPAHRACNSGRRLPVEARPNSREW